MGIGSSSGAFFQDQFHRSAGLDSNDQNVITPDQAYQNKQMDKIEETELGGIEVKDQMPFPDNHNPDMDFNSRFPNMKSGIMNDLKKPADPAPPLIRKISDVIDRRDDTPLQTVEGIVAGQLNFQKIKDVLNHPLESGVDRGMSVNAEENHPAETPLSKELGSSDLPAEKKTPKLNVTPEDIDKAISIGLGSTVGVEKVGSAALKYGGEIFTGLNHGDALEKLMGKIKDFDWKSVKDGFTTSKGRFVSREDALDLAKKSNQLQDKGLPDNVTGLLSEDLK